MIENLITIIMVQITVYTFGEFTGIKINQVKTEKVEGKDL